jgi:hypothetical protein
VPEAPISDLTSESWPYRADLPQRYSDQYKRYLARGGLVQLPDDVTAFVNGGHGRDMGRFYFFCLVLDQLKKERLIGDVAELGVYKGHTAALLASIARRLGTTAYLLDTFEGFHADDLTGIDANKIPEFADTSLDTVRALVGEDNVRYVKGRFPGSASQMPEDARFSLVHIDCDLYEPVSAGLRYFYPRLLPGGFLIVHDYSSLCWDGAERAVDEFFADKPECLVPLTDSAGSVVVRKSRAPHRHENWYAKNKSEASVDGWIEANHSSITEILGNGWADLEPWGVWGVGEVHELHIFLAGPPTGAVIIDAVVSVALKTPDASQPVDLFIGDHLLTTWEFTRSLNRCVRTVEIPAAIVAAEAAGSAPPKLTIEFRPRCVVRAKEIDPTTPDNRALGLALYRIRKRVL